MKKTITVKNDVPHLIQALWDHPACPQWLQDVLWDGINDRIESTEMTPTYWASQLESARPDEPDERERKYGMGAIEAPDNAWPEVVQ